VDEKVKGGREGVKKPVEMVAEKGVDEVDEKVKGGREGVKRLEQVDEKVVYKVDEKVKSGGESGLQGGRESG
jgi:hypothetical protein